MAIVKVVHGDLISLAKQGAFDIIGHGCNTMNLMGAGIAKSIAEAFPIALKADTKAHEAYCDPMCKHKPVPQLLGKVCSGYDRQHNLQIANMYTQVLTGRDARYEALRQTLKVLHNICRREDYRSVGLPLIGCGIGGLDENAVLALINAVLIRPNVYIIVHPESHPCLDNFQVKIHKPAYKNKMMEDYEYDSKRVG